MFMFRSNSSMVIPPAKTGKASNRRKAVINTLQTKRGVFAPILFILNTVVIKLIAPKILETPARCSLKIAISTPPVEWKTFLLRGG